MPLQQMAARMEGHATSETTLNAVRPFTAGNAPLTITIPIRGFANFLDRPFCPPHPWDAVG
jgi:hypothetical protein